VFDGCTRCRDGMSRRHQFRTEATPNSAIAKVLRHERRVSAHTSGSARGCGRTWGKHARIRIGPRTWADHPGDAGYTHGTG